jgi:hypothetical protein
MQDGTGHKNQELPTKFIYTNEILLQIIMLPQFLEKNRQASVHFKKKVKV